MPLPLPTKIRAVIESKTAPCLDCYATDDIDVAVALAVSKAFANNPITITPTKKDSKMSGVNYTGVVGLEERPSQTSAKRHVQGVSANDNAQAIVKTMTRLGLVPNDLSGHLVQIAAKGVSVSQFWQVSLDDLDRALAGVEASPQDRIGFKSSANRLGLIIKR